MGSPTPWLRARAVTVGSSTSDWRLCCEARSRKKGTSGVSLRRPLTVIVSSSMPYEKELAAAKKAATLAARLCQKVQKALLQSDVHSKSDKSPVTVADYGSQALVSFILERELPSEPFSLVAEEALREGYNPWIQKIQVKPVPKYFPDPNRGSEHQRRSSMVCWQVNGLYLQGQGEEEWKPLPLHMGQGYKAPW